MDTAPFFDAVLKGEVTIIGSDLLEAELLRAPEKVRSFLNSLPKKAIEHIKLSEYAAYLADKHIEAKVVGKTSRADCQHIAMATIANADVLVSWNFKHIVNLDRIRGYNGINYQLGYHMIEIRTPRRLLIMKQAIPKQSDGMVQSMRKIRNEISNEIKDMTFAEQRAYLDRLLSEGNSAQPLHKSPKKKISSAV